MKKISSISITSHDMTSVSHYESEFIDVCYFTHKSPVKDQCNEDALGVFIDHMGNLVLAVADGVGGQAQGDQASAIIMNELERIISTEERLWNRENILDAIEDANKMIQHKLNGAASTVAIAFIKSNLLRSIHVGDSSVLITGQRGKMKYQSTAHSPVGYAVESGLLEENEAIFHEDRHYISNVVGSSPMHIELGSTIKLATYDTVLLASDGIFDNLLVTEIIEIIRKGKIANCAENLREACHGRMIFENSDLPHKPDDMTFILYRRK